jgi:hypothetical protein
MYYLIKTNLGAKTCIDKDSKDIYTNNMNIGCGGSLTFPNNVQLVKTISINCTGTTNTINVEVYCDYITAIKINLI